MLCGRSWLFSSFFLSFWQFVIPFPSCMWFCFNWPLLPFLVLDLVYLWRVIRVFLLFLPPVDSVRLYVCGMVALTCYSRLVVFRFGSVSCSYGFCVVLVWTPLVWWSCDYLRGVGTSPCVWVWCSSRRLLCPLCLYADCSGGVVSVGIGRLSTDMGSHIMSMCCVLSAIHTKERPDDGPDIEGRNMSCFNWY
jgi:hypothetical protein